MKVLRGVTLLSTVAASLCVSSAWAQDGSDDVIEEIVATGIRSSLQQSIDIKRDATQVVDAVSAEDVGKFPDPNVAEALQRITGVSIEIGRAHV